MKYTSWDAPARAVPTGDLSPLVSRVLCARGLTDPAAAREFLRVDPGLLRDPFLMRDMDKAVRRVTEALERGETLAVYGDYDVDGMTSACLLYDFFTRRGGHVIRYIPRRLSEGYGLNKGALDTLHDRGCALVVTVDCGITAVEEVEYAKTLGMDVVITDHHTCKDALPQAVAVVDPQRPDCPYPFKGLAGVGVALKLAMAMGAALEDYVDLAALGTVADVMPLVDENRAIVSMGLGMLTDRPGIAALLDEADAADEPVNATSLSYTVCPRLNAAGRLGDTRAAEELLLCRDRAAATPLAQELCRLNRERQRLEGEIFDQCVADLERSPVPDNQAAILLSGERWHQGVVGIVASRISERYDKPAFIVSMDNGMGKGSCRSAGGVSLFRALEGCSDVLEGYGGHDMAAGFTVKEENIPALREALSAWVAEHRDRDAGRRLQTDWELESAELLTQENVEALDALEPFGAGNPKPVFVLRGCEASGVSRVGDQGRHLKFSACRDGRTLTGIFFSCPREAGDPGEGDRVDVAFTPQINHFRGRSSVQLVAADLRRSQSVYEKFCQGEALTPEEARALIPSRADFEWVWRHLRPQANPPVDWSAEGSVDRDRSMVSLDVFEERGLIRLERDGHTVSVHLQPRRGKVDLEESPILRGLRAAAGRN